MCFRLFALYDIVSCHIALVFKSNYLFSKFRKFDGSHFDLLVQYVRKCMRNSGFLPLGQERCLHLKTPPSKKNWPSVIRKIDLSLDYVKSIEICPSTSFRCFTYPTGN